MNAAEIYYVYGFLWSIDFYGFGYGIYDTTKLFFPALFSFVFFLSIKLIEVPLTIKTYAQSLYLWPLMDHRFLWSWIWNLRPHKKFFIYSKETQIL